jgi:hypothetical protein
MAKEWANKDRYHPSHGVLESRMPLPKGKGFVRKVPTWEMRDPVAEVVVWRERTDRLGMAVRPVLPREGRLDRPG